MSLTLLTTYVLACVLLAITPGPNMSLCIANTLSNGLKGGLATLSGAAIGFTVLVSAAATGMNSIMVFMAEWFDVIRWVGAIYLIWLGFWQFRAFLRRRNSDNPLPPPATHHQGFFWQGLAVSLSNPKVILFLGAFLPQFVTPGDDVGLQLAILAALFVATLLIVDISYTVAIALLRARVEMRKLALLDGFAGALLMAGGIFLATTRRP